MGLFVPISGRLGSFGYCRQGIAAKCRRFSPKFRDKGRIDWYPSRAEETASPEFPVKAVLVVRDMWPPKTGLERKKYLHTVSIVPAGMVGFVTPQRVREQIMADLSKYR
ncbi:MAG: hypothetical protein AAFO63_03400, partial [Pseudomonadota bacterium]